MIRIVTGADLRNARIRANLNQHELAARLRNEEDRTINQGRISEMENDQRPITPFYHAQLIVELDPGDDTVN